MHAADPVTEAGLHMMLRSQPGIDLWEDTGGAGPDVRLLAVDTIDQRADLCRVRQVGDASAAPVALIVTELHESSLVHLADTRVLGVLRKAEIAVDRLAQVVTAVARGHGYAPPDLLPALLRGARPAATGFSDRDLAVLRRVADGFTTAEIAEDLAYSERTIKNIIAGVCERHGLKTRSEAAVFVTRRGLI
ncbi:helix-turn-helix transcriptional regulator [Streptomyces sp. G-5]|uniref:helix-turn-helix transcriptional regulator n=1 Tax=Streptomyces sp. G-5 TaxID=2977231 RepID=UPI0021CEC2FA|nr:LuxR C-terminal-related transcriptional regulator [Streptomyces sp. G-5]MCU4750242.1 LuxR C-terminal-related transcriptional regulator [Streptomyces sp. G-5]